MIDPLASLSERRERYRISLCGRVWATLPTGESLDGHLNDLSAAGVSFVSTFSLLPNTQLDIYVQLEPEGSQPITGVAEVMHTALQADGSYQVRCRLTSPLQ